jgi:uncharacterized protein (DUF983 family)
MNSRSYLDKSIAIVGTGLIVIFVIFEYTTKNKLWLILSLLVLITIQVAIFREVLRKNESNPKRTIRKNET